MPNTPLHFFLNEKTYPCNHLEWLFDWSINQSAHTLCTITNLKTNHIYLVWRILTPCSLLTECVSVQNRDGLHYLWGQFTVIINVDWLSGSDVLFGRGFLPQWTNLGQWFVFYFSRTFKLLYVHWLFKTLLKNMTALGWSFKQPVPIPERHATAPMVTTTTIAKEITRNIFDLSGLFPDCLRSIVWTEMSSNSFLNNHEKKLMLSIIYFFFLFFFFVEC